MDFRNGLEVMKISDPNNTYWVIRDKNGILWHQQEDGIPRYIGLDENLIRNYCLKNGKQIDPTEVPQIGIGFANPSR